MLVRNNSGLGDKTSRFQPNSWPDFWVVLNRIQGTLRLKDAHMAELMRMTEKEFRRLKNRRIEPRVPAGMALAHALNIGFDSLILNNIDYVALERHFYGESSYIPEKYTVAAQSHRRTVINLLNFIEMRRGWEMRQQTLRRFQLSESMFAEPDALINLRLPVDISEWLYKQFPNERFFYDMGKNSFETHSRSVVGEELRSSRNLRELFEMMFAGVAEKYIERNLKWVLTTKHYPIYTIEGTPSEELRSALGDQIYRSHATCLVRKGFISSIACYLGHPAQTVTKTACLAHGDSSCKFSVDLSEALKKRH